MISPIGLDKWEVVALAGILAVAWVGVSSCAGAALAWLVFREKKVAHAPVVVAEPAKAPAAAREPELAAAGA